MSLNETKQSGASSPLIDSQHRISELNGSAPSRELQIEVALEQVSAALYSLYDLLEKYAPQWYTLSQHERVESALRMVGKL